MSEATAKPEGSSATLGTTGGETILEVSDLGSPVPLRPPEYS